MSSNKNKVSSALQPRNQSSPFGTLTNAGGKTAYNPTYQAGQQNILSQAPTNESSLLSTNIPKATDQYTGQVGNYLGNVNSLTAGNMVNPQVYNAMYGLEANPLLSQYHQDTNNLNNELAMKNLSGGSYDALAHGQLDKNLGLNLSNAANQAALGGLQATGDYLGWQQQGADTAGTQLGNLGNSALNDQNLSSSLQSQLMNPFQQYSTYQTAVNPLQEQMAKYDASQPTGLQKAGSFMSAAAPFANFIPGIGPVVSAGLQLGGAALNSTGPKLGAGM